MFVFPVITVSARTDREYVRNFERKPSVEREFSLIIPVILSIILIAHKYFMTSLDDLSLKFKNLIGVRVNFRSPVDDMQVDQLKIEFIHFNIQI